MKYSQMNGERKYPKNSQAHWQVAEADTNQSLPKSLPILTHGKQKLSRKLNDMVTENKEHQVVTSATRQVR